MSLPSQTGRSGGFRTARFSVSKRRRRSPAPRIAAALLLVGALGLAWWWWPDTDPGADAPRLTDASDSPSAAAPTGDQPGFASPLVRGGTADRPRDAYNGSNESPVSRGGNSNGSSGVPALDMGADDDGRNQADRSAPANDEVLPAPAPERQTSPAPNRDRPDAGNRNAPRDTPAGSTGARSPRTDSPISALLAEADGALEDGRPAIAREVLNRALHHRAALDAERDYLRDRLSQLAEIMTFSPRVVPGDSMVREYAVQSGDFLSTIARRENALTDWKFIQRVNGMDNPNRLRVGQSLKIVQGPMHALVDKSEYRLDLYADERDSAGNRLFLTSFRVGLGEFDSTPVGAWIVKNRLENPAWVNPRDGRERYDANDPENPIGEFWVGLDGTDENTKAETGIGLHGTIEPHTIGQQASMGCVRLLPDDIALIYEVLIPGRSEVVIRD